MILYKYLPASRIDVILKQKIRFTQYGDLNDPFESLPKIDKLTEQNAIRVLIKTDFAKLIEDEYDKYPYLAAFVTKPEFVKLAKSREYLLKDSFNAFLPTIINLLPAMFKKTMDLSLGALSLSEINDHELMWSHYSENHKGYVIGFDGSHPFFNQKKTISDELRHLRKIVYYDIRPQITLMDTNGTELFFTKSSKWKYEAEMRMLLPLSCSSEIIESTPYPIHLFTFPIEAIAEIIFGMRMSENDKKIIKTALNSSKKASHINYFKACLHDSSYIIQIEKEV